MYIYFYLDIILNIQFFFFFEINVYLVAVKIGKMKWKEV